MTADVLETRRDANHQRMLSLARFCAVMLAMPAIAVGLLAGVALGNPFLGGVIMVVVAVAIAAWMFTSMRGFGSRFVSSLGVGTSNEAEQARLHNLADGLSVANGVTKPDLYVLDDPSLNICTVITVGGESSRAAMVLTSGLVASLERIELEAVLAQQVAHLRDGDASLSSFAASLVAIPFVGSILANRVRTVLDPELEAWGDLAGVRLTRYPPGLAAALEKLEAGSTTVAVATPATAHLWFADPLGGQSDAGVNPLEPFIPHPPLEDRIAVLREL